MAEKKLQKVSTPENPELIKVREAAEISAMCRAAGLNITIPHMGIILGLKELHSKHGTKSSLEDVQNIVTVILRNPNFNPPQQGQQ